MCPTEYSSWYHLRLHQYFARSYSPCLEKHDQQGGLLMGERTLRNNLQVYIDGFMHYLSNRRAFSFYIYLCLYMARMLLESESHSSELPSCGNSTVNTSLILRFTALPTSRKRTHLFLQFVVKAKWTILYGESIPSRSIGTSGVKVYQNCQSTSGILAHVFGGHCTVWCRKYGDVCVWCAI